MTRLQGTTAGFDTDFAIYLTGPQGAALVKVVQAGDATASLNGVFDWFHSSHVPSVREDGAITFRASLRDTFGSSEDDSAIYRYFSGSLDEIAREGEATPDGDGTLGNFEASTTMFPYCARDMDVVFSPSAIVGVPGNTAQGAFLGNGNTTTRRIGEGDDIAGEDAYLHDTNSFTPNAVGDCAATGSLMTSEGSLTLGLFRSHQGEVQALALSQRPAPDTGGTDNGVFQSFATGDGPTMNKHGELAFFARVDGSSDPSVDTSGLFFTDGSDLTAIVRRGMTVPSGNGRFITLVSGAHAMNANGDVAFIAGLTGTEGGPLDDTGVFFWERATGELSEIVREGDLSPDGNGELSFFDEPALNDSGHLAFQAQLRDSEFGPADDEAIYFHAEETGLLTAVREQDTVSSGDILDRVFFRHGAGAQGQQRSGLSADGQVAFSALSNGPSLVGLWSPPFPVGFTPPAPEIRLVGSTALISIFGESGLSYQLERFRPMEKDWIPIGSAARGADASLEVADPNASSRPASSYRYRITESPRP